MLMVMVDMLMLVLMVLMRMLMGMVRLNAYAYGAPGDNTTLTLTHGSIAELGRWRQDDHAGTTIGQLRASTGRLEGMRPRVGFVGVGLDRWWKRRQRYRVPLLEVLLVRLRSVRGQRRRLLARQRVVPLEAGGRRAGTVRTIVGIVVLFRVASSLRRTIDRLFLSPNVGGGGRSKA